MLAVCRAGLNRAGLLFQRLAQEVGEWELSCGPALLIGAVFMFAAGVAVAAYDLHPGWLLTPCAYPLVALLIEAARCRQETEPPEENYTPSISVGVAALLERRPMIPAGILWRFLALFALVLMPLASWGYTRWSAESAVRGSPACLLSRQDRSTVCFRALVEEATGFASGKGVRLIVTLRELSLPYRKDLSGRVLVCIYGLCLANKPYRPGELLEITGKLHAIPAPQYPWQFDYRRYLERRGIFAQVDTNQGRVVSLGESFAQGVGFEHSVKRWLAAVRLKIVERHRLYSGSPEGELLASIVLGERAVKLPEEVSESFRLVGLAHILAASGFNLSIVIASTWWFARLVRLSPGAVNLACFMAMLAFVGLAGPSPSVTRAALMCSLLLFSRCLYRSAYAPSALAIALFVSLCVDPFSITDVGLQLSYSATAGIILGALVVKDCLKRAGRMRPPGCNSVEIRDQEPVWRQPADRGGAGILYAQGVVLGHNAGETAAPPGKEPTLKHRRVNGIVPVWICDCVSIVVCAQAAVLPLQLLYFWETGLMFLPANLLVAPVIPVITVAGFVSSSVAIVSADGSLLDQLVKLLDRLAAFPLSVMLALIRWMAEFDSARITAGSPGVCSVWLYYLAFVLLILVIKRHGPILVALLLFSIALAGLFYRPPLSELTLACFPHAVVVAGADRSCVVFGDAGDKGAGRFLRYHGIRFESKHVRGAASCVRNGDAGILSLEGDRSGAFNVLRNGPALTRIRAKLSKSTILLVGRTSLSEVDRSASDRADVCVIYQDSGSSHKTNHVAPGPGPTRRFMARSGKRGSMAAMSKQAQAAAALVSSSKCRMVIICGQRRWAARFAGLLRGFVGHAKSMDVMKAPACGLAFAVDKNGIRKLP